MRINSITSLRFLAAFGVLLFHILPSWLPKYFSPDNVWIRPISLGYTSVPFFFLLSGFALSLWYFDRISDRVVSFREFWISRFARIWPLLILSLCIGIVPLFPALLREGGVLYAVFHSILYFMVNAFGLGAWFPSTVRINYPVWSLSVEAFFYLLFPFLAFYGAKIASWKKSFFFFWALSFVVPVVVLLILPEARSVKAPYPDDWRAPSQIWQKIWLQLDGNPIVHLPTFLAGIALAKGYKTGDLEEFGGTYVLALVLFIAALVWLLSDSIYYLLIHTGLLVPFFSCVVAVAIYQKQVRSILEWPILVFLGEASYALYMLHVPIRDILSFVWNKTGVRDTSIFPYLVVGSLVCCIFTSCFIYRFFELPAKKYVYDKLTKIKLSNTGSG